MGTLLRRHATLVAFSLSLAGSTAFVACGSDTNTSTIQLPDGGGGFDTGTGGGVASGSGGAGAGGKAASGAGGTATSAGGVTGTAGGAAVVDSGSDAVTSNGDAQVDAANPENN
jgi:hypothetical protein